MQALQRPVGSGHGIVYSIFQGITHPLHAAKLRGAGVLYEVQCITLPLFPFRPL